MAERPFIATGNEIRAALEDGKVTVWRDVKPQPKWQEDPTFIAGPPDSWVGRYQSAPYGDPEVDEHYCPLGAPGDVLWWQEEWGTGCRPDPRYGWRDGIEYAADEAYLDDIDLLPLYSDLIAPDDFEYDAVPEGWQPASTLPRWATRITTTVTSVNCELRDGRWQWRVEVERKEPTT